MKTSKNKAIKKFDFSKIPSPVAPSPKEVSDSVDQVQIRYTILQSIYKRCESLSSDIRKNPKLDTKPQTIQLYFGLQAIRGELGSDVEFVVFKIRDAILEQLMNDQAIKSYKYVLKVANIYEFEKNVFAVVRFYPTAFLAYYEKWLKKAIPLNQIPPGNLSGMYWVSRHGKRIWVNGLYCLSKPHLDKANDNFFEFIVMNPNRTLKLQEIKDGNPQLKRAIPKVINDLGFVGKIREAFFPMVTEKRGLRFRPMVKRDDLTADKIDEAELVKQLEKAHILQK